MNKLTKAVVVGIVGLELLTNIGCEVVPGLIGTAGATILTGKKEGNNDCDKNDYNTIQNIDYGARK